MAVLGWLVFVGGVAAQEGGTIRGTAIGSDGRAPRSAEATLPDLRRRTEVAADGSFEFPGVPPGSYLVVVSSPLQGHGVSRVEVVAGKTTSFEMEMHVVTHSEEVVVSASPDLRSQLELASPTTVVSGEDLEIARQATLGETLAGEPGISATSFAQGASRPVIRGFDGDRVRMLSGGIGTGDASSTSPDHGVAIDPAMAVRIEVLRGPATLLYGSSAIGGVVNVEDGRIPSFRPSVPFGGRVEVGLGSVSDERRGTVALDGGGGDWGWHLDGTLTDAGDYEIPESAVAGTPSGTQRLTNSDNRTTGASIGGTRFFEGGSLGMAATRFGSEYGLPVEPGVRIDMEQQRFDLRGEVTSPFGPFRGLRVRAGVTDYEHSELDGGDVTTTFFNDYWEGRAELVQKRRGRLAGSVGAQISSQEALGQLDSRSSSRP